MINTSNGTTDSLSAPPAVRVKSNHVHVSTGTRGTAQVEGKVRFCAQYCDYDIVLRVAQERGWEVVHEFQRPPGGSAKVFHETCKLCNDKPCTISWVDS